MSQNLVLDSAIRDWVLLPPVFIVLFIGILRHFVAIAMTGKPKPPTISSIPEQQLAGYSRFVLANSSQVPYESFKQRAEWLLPKLARPLENNQMAAMMDPGMMSNMMKSNVTATLPNIAMMSLVQAIFSGFVVAKFPFALSNRFKGMVQRGVDIDNLDGSYATSLSLYFLIMFGLQSVIQLLLGRNEGDETQMMKQQMSNPMGQQQAPQDMNKVNQALTEELKFALDTHAYQLENAVALLLQGK